MASFSEGQWVEADPYGLGRVMGVGPEIDPLNSLLVRFERPAPGLLALAEINNNLRAYFRTRGIHFALVAEPRWLCFGLNGQSYQPIHGASRASNLRFAQPPQVHFIKPMSYGDLLQGL